MVLETECLRERVENFFQDEELKDEKNFLLKDNDEA